MGEESAAAPSSPLTFCVLRSSSRFTFYVFPAYHSPMPQDHSFDIVSEINLQEMDNAVNQAIKEVITRYDFKGTSASVSELNRKDKELTLTADIEAQLDAVKKVLVEKMIKRGVDPK